MICYFFSHFFLFIFSFQTNRSSLNKFDVSWTNAVFYAIVEIFRFNIFMLLLMRCEFLTLSFNIVSSTQMIMCFINTLYFSLFFWIVERTEWNEARLRNLPKRHVYFELSEFVPNVFLLNVTLIRRMRTRVIAFSFGASFQQIIVMWLRHTHTLQI